MARLHGTTPIDREKLREARLARGMTQEGLAAKAGLALRTICHLERGVTKQPEILTKKALEAALGVDLTPKNEKEAQHGITSERAG